MDEYGGSMQSSGDFESKLMHHVESARKHGERGIGHFRTTATGYTVDTKNLTYRNFWMDGDIANLGCSVARVDKSLMPADWGAWMMNTEINGSSIYFPTSFRMNEARKRLGDKISSVLPDAKYFVSHKLAERMGI